MSGDGLIKDFAGYVKKYGHGISLDTAQNYAMKGQKILEKIRDGESLPSSVKLDGNAAACILWCLLKAAYENGESFGKGTFNIAFDKPELTIALFEALRGAALCYPRLSTHYKDVVKDGHYGIDLVKPETFGKITTEPVTWPGPFRTVCFGLCVEEGIGTGTSLYFKPENYGVDFKNNHEEAFLHTLDLGKSMVVKDKMPGTESKRETANKENEKDLMHRGDEVRFFIPPKGGKFIEKEEVIVGLERQGYSSTSPHAQL